MKNTSLLWTLSLLVIGITFAMIGIHWSDLPEQVPMHFNAQGIADRYGDKRELLILPVISLGLIIMLRWINKKAMKINIHKIGARTEQELTLSKVMTAQLALFVAVLLGYATYQSMAVSVGKQDGISGFFLGFSSIGLLIIIISYLWKLFRLQ